MNTTFLPMIPPPSQEFPKFRDLSHLTLSASYVDVDSDTNSLVALCKNCPRLQSLVITDFQGYGYARNSVLCDVLVGFATELTNARAEGRGLGTHLQDLTLEGKWGSISEEDIDYELHDSVDYLASDFFDWWETQPPFASLFDSAGISYKEDFTMWHVPLEQRTRRWRLEVEEERRREELAANAVQPE